MTNILILSLQGLGNIVLFAPILEAFVKDNAGASVTLVVSDNGSHQFIGPLCNRLGVECKVWHESDSAIMNIVRLVLLLRTKRFSTVYSTYPSAKRENILSFMAHGKQKHTIKDTEEYLKLLQFLNPAACTMQGGLHDFQKMACLFGVKEPGFRKRFDRLLSGPIIIGVHPGSSSRGKGKRWDVYKYRALLSKCSQTFDCEFVLFGGSEEYDLISCLEAGKYQKRAVIGQPFPDLQKEISNCDIFIGNDSSLIHMAALSGAFVMAIWAYTDFKRTAPFGKGNILVKAEYDCSSCYGLGGDYIDDCRYHLRCIRGMSVGEVYAVMEHWINILKEGNYPSEKCFLELDCVSKTEMLPHGCIIVSLRRNDV